MSEVAKKGSAQGVVPGLRFPEFRSAPHWRVTPLDDLCGKITNGSANAVDHEDGGLYPLFDRSEVVKRSNRFIFDAEAVIVPGEGIRLIPRYFEGKFNLHQRAYALMQHKGDARFVCYALDHYNARLVRSAVYSTVPSLRLPIIEHFTIPTPAKDEQKKIADCLSSLDDLITAHADKLAALKQHKQGLLEQLFPREGETVPRLRFPEFNGGLAWAAKRLSDVAYVVRGGSPRPIDKYLTEASDGLAWLKIGDIAGDAKYITRTSQRIKRAGLSKTREIHSGDLILSNSMSFGRPYISGISACIHDGWLAITELSSAVTSEFMYYLLGGGVCQRYFADAAAGSGVHNLNIDIVGLTPVTLPGKLEQQKITDCLSGFDDLITAQSDQLTALKEHKQGLLQQLFPVMDAAA